MNTEENTQKRQEFRLQIRRRDIQNKFAKLRQEFFQQEKLKTSEGSLECAVEIQTMMEAIWAFKKESRWLEIPEAIKIFSDRTGACFNGVEGEENSEISNVLTMGLNFLLETSASKVEELCSESVNEDEFFDEPCTSLPNPNLIHQVPISPEILIEIIFKSTQLLKCIQPERLTKEPYICLVKLLGKALKELIDIRIENSNDEIKEMHLEGVTNIMRILKAFIFSESQSSESMTMEILLNEGISSKLTEIISYNLQFDSLFQHSLLSQTHELSSQNIIDLHMNTLILIYALLQCDQSIAEDFEDSQDTHSILVEVKKHYLAYGLYVLQATEAEEGSLNNDQHKYLVTVSLQMLAVLLDKEETLAGGIADSSYSPLFSILSHQGNYEEHIVCSVLNLLEIVCRDYEVAGEKLIEKYFILDEIEKELMRLDNNVNFSYTQPEVMQNRLQLSIKILINLLQSKTKHFRIVLYLHSIWEKVFKLLSHHPNFYSKLLTLFPAYFNCFGPKVVLKDLPFFLSICSSVDLSNEYLNDMKEIRQALCTIYINSKNILTEEGMEMVKVHYENYGAKKYLYFDYHLL